jgi:hypothetical protein
MGTFIDAATAPASITRGPELEADTHCMIVSGAGAVTAIDTTIGTITLPAGGEWRIFGAFCQAVLATPTPAQGLSGHFRLDPASGDLKPHPAPSRMPFPAIPAMLGATTDVVASPLDIIPVNYVAPGKAQIGMIFHQDTTNTVAPQVVMGLIFGHNVPVRTNLVFCDRVQAAVTLATETSLGTITLSENAKMITGLCGTIVGNGVLTTLEELIGQFRLTSDDVKLAPSSWPFSTAYSAGLGALINQGDVSVPIWIDCAIPVIGGARIDIFADLNTAFTNGAHTQVFLKYE